MHAFTAKADEYSHSDNTRDVLEEFAHNYHLSLTARPGKDAKQAAKGTDQD